MSQNIIEKVMTHPALLSEPPVLVDVGASGGIHPKWKQIAKYSICVAFDPDTRAIHISETSGFKKLIMFNSIVGLTDGQKDFYLTHSPYCSSTLKPNAESLKRFEFAGLFQVQKQTSLKSTRLSTALDQLNIHRVDWIKIDSQGTDLPIFESLPLAMRGHILVAEFEPGIIDAYSGEDKVANVLSQNDAEQFFFLSDMCVKGVPRIRFDLADSFGNNRSAICKGLKAAPCWAELTFMKDIYLNLANIPKMTLRDWLLLWVFAVTERQHGYAYEIANEMKIQFSEPIIADICKASKRMVRIAWIRGRFLPLKKRLIHLLDML